MKRFKAQQIYLLFILILSVFLTTGCGGGDVTGHWLSGIPDTTPPTVTFTVPASADTGVALNAKISATFSEAMDPATIITPATTFTLKQGATVIPGAVAYLGVTAVFTPTSTLTANTTYTATITTVATDLAGNPLSGNLAPFPAASNYVWSFTTGAAPDTTPPTVTHTINANGATGVPINTKIIATFSEAMDPLTITAATFTFKQGTTTVPGTVSYVGVTAVYTPLSLLAANTTYTGTITTGATDLAGNQLSGNQGTFPAASNYVWSWTTGPAPDTTPPTVTNTINANGATGVPINTKVGVTFSKAMDPLTITNLTFTLKQGTTNIPGTVIYSGVSAVFTPLSLLAANTTYTATITTGATDLAGNQLSGNQGTFPAASNYVWSWTTGPAPDTTAPTVILTIPINNATGVAINTKVSATFSKAMNPLTITNLTFTLKQGATAIPGSVIYSGVTAVLTPLSPLAFNTIYTGTITTAAKDLAGNALAINYVWNFTTGAAPDTTPPTVILTVPASTAPCFLVPRTIIATFSKVMDPLTINTATFTLKQGATPIQGTVTYSGATGVFTTFLGANTAYTATITTGAKDLAGNALASDNVLNFTTAECTPPPIPFVSSVNLGLAAPFAIASAANLTNTITAPITHINGNVVMFPTGTCNATVLLFADGPGFGACTSGAATGPPTHNAGDLVISPTYPDLGITALAVRNALKAAYVSISPPGGAPVGPLGPGTTILAPTTLGTASTGRNTFTPGIYTDTAAAIQIQGDLTLDAGGNPNAEFFFQTAGTLTTIAGTRILLTGSAKASNVWWQVGSSATLGTGTEFQGNILADTSITMLLGTTSCGRLLAGAFTATGAFVFDSNVVAVPGQPFAPGGIARVCQ